MARLATRMANDRRLLWESGVHERGRIGVAVSWQPKIFEAFSSRDFYARA